MLGVVFEIPEDISNKAKSFLDPRMIDIVERFEAKYVR